MSLVPGRRMSTEGSKHEDSALARYMNQVFQDALVVRNQWSHVSHSKCVPDYSALSLCHDVHRFLFVFVTARRGHSMFIPHGNARLR